MITENKKNEQIALASLSAYPEFGDILNDRLFLSMAGFRHHADTSCLSHTLTVALATLRSSRQLNLNYVSATRGALLHDFYLYDWHTDSPGLHGFKHPSIALKNAERVFRLNPIERNIIHRHMWPLTPIPPKYPEAWLVCLIDKYVSAKEYSREFIS